MKSIYAASAALLFVATSAAGGLLRDTLSTAVAVLNLPALAEPAALALPPSVTDCPAGGDADGDGVINGEAGDETGGVDLGGDVTGGAGPCLQPRVVVSVVDSRLNPYHAYFYPGASGVTPAVRAAFGIDAEHILRLTRTGDVIADRVADAALWASVQPGEHYWVAGTNLIVINFAPDASELLAQREDDISGTAAAAAVLAANPDAIVMFVGSGDRLGHDAAEVAGFLHPEVDIVATGYSASMPLIELGLPTPGFVHSPEAVFELGKLHFAQTANAPDPTTPLAAGAGPWWSIGIKGIESGTSGGATLLSGLLGDFAADARQVLPNCGLCEDGSGAVVGTAVATAQAAGVASRALFELRRTLGQTAGITQRNGAALLAASDDVAISNWQLRRALEVAAAVPGTTEYSFREGLQETVGVPVAATATWALLGWGVLTPDPAAGVVDETLAQLGYGTSARAKNIGYCLFQSTGMTVRRLYWNALSPLLFQSEKPQADPYLRC